MRNETSIHAVEAARFGEHFAAPLYESYCFSNIPGTLKLLLGAETKRCLPLDVLGDLPRRYEKVVLIYLDAFGWDAFARARDQYPFLQRFAQDGVESKLTSQFPSTTSAHVTTLYADLTVGESGVYEWYFYEPLFDRVICPLLFSYAGDEDPGTLIQAGIPAADFLPTRTLHQELHAAGVNTYILQHKEISKSPYSMVATNGAHKLIDFTTIPEACTLLGEALTASSDPALYFLYIDDVDEIGHRHGPDSVQYAAELDSCLTNLERNFFGRLGAVAADTLLLLTTDHGQVPTAPQTNRYLNEELPELAPLLASNREGRLLAPAGSPRDYFLHVRAGKLDEANDLLTERLRGFAEVHKTADLIARGLFGPTVSDTFRARVGDLVILPYGGNTVWWHEQKRFEMKHHGLHGGLSQAEMEIPFLALPL